MKKAIKSYLTPVSHAHLFDRDVVIHGGDDEPHKTVIMKESDYKDIGDHDEQLLIAAEVKSCVEHYRVISYAARPDPIAVFEACQLSK